MKKNSVLSLVMVASVGLGQAAQAAVLCDRDVNAPERIMNDFNKQLTVLAQLVNSRKGISDKAALTRQRDAAKNADTSAKAAAALAKLNFETATGKSAACEIEEKTLQGQYDKALAEAATPSAALIKLKSELTALEADLVRLQDERRIHKAPAVDKAKADEGKEKLRYEALIHPVCKYGETTPQCGAAKNSNKYILTNAAKGVTAAQNALISHDNAMRAKENAISAKKNAIAKADKANENAQVAALLKSLNAKKAECDRLDNAQVAAQKTQAQKDEAARIAAEKLLSLEAALATYDDSIPVKIKAAEDKIAQLKLDAKECAGQLATVQGVVKDLDDKIEAAKKALADATAKRKAAYSITRDFNNSINQLKKVDATVVPAAGN
jgi:fused signal recognition particle receptor